MIFRFGTAPCSHRPTKQQSTTAFSHLFLMRRCPLWGLSDAGKIHKARNPAESVGKCRHGDETYKGRQSTAARRLSGQEVGASSRAGNKQNKSTQGLRSSSVIRPRKFQAARGRRMSTRVVGESRRSTRVPLQILITLLSLDEPLTCEGETITAIVMLRSTSLRFFFAEFLGSMRSELAERCALRLRLSLLFWGNISLRNFAIRCDFRRPPFARI